MGVPIEALVGNTVQVFKQENRRKVENTSEQWSVPSSVIVRGLALAGDTLILAGTPDVGKKAEKDRKLVFANPEEAVAASRGEMGAQLQILDTRDGKKVFETKLAAPPVFDGISSSKGRIYISLHDGTVECWK